LPNNQNICLDFIHLNVLIYVLNSVVFCSDNTSYNNTYNNRNKRMHFNNNCNKTGGYNQRGRGNLNNNNHSQRQPYISHESQLSPNNNVPTSTNRYTRN